MKKTKQTDQSQMLDKKPESKDNESVLTAPKSGFKSTDTVGFSLSWLT